MNKPLGATKDIKVMLVGPVPPPYGGIPYYVKTLFESGISEVEFSLFNTALPASVAPLNREGARSYRSLFEGGIWISIKKVLFVLFSFPWLAYAILRDKPQIVQIFTCSYWGYWRNWIYVLVSRLLGRKTIFHLLGAIDIFYAEASEVQRAWLRKSLNSADSYLVQSPELQRWMQQYTKHSVKSLWNGIYIDQIPLKAESPPQFIAAQNWPIGITVGGLGKNKGTSELIKAVARLKSAQVHLGWVFVGSGDIDYFRSLAESNGVAEHIHFTGAIADNEKWQYLHYADIFCLPSYAEGQPVSIIEAMAVGLPVVSTSVGSIHEMINDGVEGYIIPPVDIDMLVFRIEDLIHNPEKRARMGKKAQQRARERHNIHLLFDNLVSVYSELRMESREIPSRMNWHIKQ